jgi:hypothetical protein
MHLAQYPDLPPAYMDESSVQSDLSLSMAAGSPARMTAAAAVAARDRSLAGLQSLDKRKQPRLSGQDNQDEEDADLPLEHGSVYSANDDVPPAYINQTVTAPTSAAGAKAAVRNTSAAKSRSLGGLRSLGERQQHRLAENGEEGKEEDGSELPLEHAAIYGEDQDMPPAYAGKAATVSNPVATAGSTATNKKKFSLSSALGLGMGGKKKNQAVNLQSLSKPTRPAAAELDPNFFRTSSQESMNRSLTGEEMKLPPPHGEDNV